MFQIREGDEIKMSEKAKDNWWCKKGSLNGKCEEERGFYR